MSITYLHKQDHEPEAVLEKFLNPSDIRKSSRDLNQATYARRTQLEGKRQGHSRQNPADEWLEVNKMMMSNPRNPYIQFMITNPACGPGLIMGNEAR